MDVASQNGSLFPEKCFSVEVNTFSFGLFFFLLVFYIVLSALLLLLFSDIQNRRSRAESKHIAGCCGWANGYQRVRGLLRDIFADLNYFTGGD